MTKFLNHFAISYHLLRHIFPPLHHIRILLITFPLIYFLVPIDRGHGKINFRSRRDKRMSFLLSSPKLSLRFKLGAFETIQYTSYRDRTVLSECIIIESETRPGK